MRIVAALPWYDEPVAFLDRCVRSLAGVADELVAVDGRWEHYSDTEPVLSHWTQAQAIARAADAIALDHRVWMGPNVWGSQVAKRAALMELASEAGDWILVIDADEYIANSLPGHLRPALQETELDVGLVGFTTLNGSRPPSRIRRIFRRGTTVKTAHNGYNLGGRWLHGDSAHVRLEDAVDVSAYVSMHDDCGARDELRTEKKRDYRQARARHRLEAWR